MGAWSHHSFGNDQALDFLLELERLDGAQALEAVRRAFADLADYEQRRLAGTNTYVLTEDRWRADLLECGVDPYDIDEHWLPRMSFGATIVDTGDSEAFIAIAAAEVLLAQASGDHSAMGEDGAFLRAIDIPFATADLDSARIALESLLVNRPLLKERGARWKKGLVAILERLAAAIAGDPVPPATPPAKPKAAPRRTQAPKAGACLTDDPHVLVYLPPLLFRLHRAERDKGAPLTQAEVLAVRDRAVCMSMPLSEAREQAEARGYADLDAEDLWVEWQAARSLPRPFILT
jgi:hypothetical protein